MNAFVDTMVGKVFLDNPDDFKPEMYDNMWIVNDEDQVVYNKTANPSNLMVEALSENDPIAFGKQFLNLPDVTPILSFIEENIDDFE